MAAIKGMENMSVVEVNAELAKGAKFVVFQYCISVIFMTFKQPTAIYFVKAGDSTASKSWGPTLTTVLLGWWGIPWGPIYSISSLYTNLTGGKDVTADVIKSLQA